MHTRSRFEIFLALRSGPLLPHLEDELDVVGHGYPITIGQGQDLVVVQDRVEVLDPDGVHGSVAYDPLGRSTEVEEKTHQAARIIIAGHYPGEVPGLDKNLAIVSTHGP